MSKHFLFASIFLFGLTSQISYAQHHNFEKTGIEYVWEDQADHFKCKKIFLDAFVKCYDPIALDVLKKKSREEVAQFLDDSFEELYSHYKTSKDLLWLCAKTDNQIVGFLVIDISKYPEEIYLAQLAIDPTYQRRGIASSMIKSLLDQFSNCNKFVVITRYANEEAKSLYAALGFSPSAYIHEGYSRELYTGFEYTPLKKDGPFLTGKVN